MQNPGFDVVVITGGFDPLHSGHLSYIKAAADLGQVLVVGVNSDDWLTRKKSRAFMPFIERLTIIKEIKYVNHAIGFDDTDSSGKDAINWARKQFPNSKIIFANGGDRTEMNIPEMDIEDDNIEFIFGVGGTNKKNSSSWILEEWKAPKTERLWGYYRVLHENGKEVKVKELTVEPGKYLSMQRHFKRSELWFVSEGVATLYTIDYSSDYVNTGAYESFGGTYEQFDTIHIPKNKWHQLANETNSPLKIIEIQYGEDCIEEDITRK
jgi:D-beta-D-heptose 7-phosphate kinase/D-beta-D-heptose 1-phosphate adenosyltransferase